jgi:hypothetical protein
MTEENDEELDKIQTLEMAMNLLKQVSAGGPNAVSAYVKRIIKLLKKYGPMTVREIRKHIHVNR